MKELDIRASKLKGDELKKHIQEEMEATQSVIIQELPSTLLITTDQFNDLNNDLMASALQKNRLYFTGKYVLEVEVRD